MTIPPPPPETVLRGSEQAIGQWDFLLEMRQSPVAQILMRFILTNERLVVLQFPTARVTSRIMGRLSLGKPTSSFMQDMGRWHVMLDSQLSVLPEPVLGRVKLGHPTALPSDRALILGPRNFPVGEDPGAEAMAKKVRNAWATARSSQSGPLT